MNPRLERAPLRDQIRTIVKSSILEGTLRPEARVGIFDLARELGTSPTPVREAMAQLERSGFLVAEPSRGFFVAELSMDEVKDLFPMIWQLESLGATSGLSGSGAGERFARLRDLNARIMESEGNTQQTADLDRLWHQELTSGSDNALLAQVLGELKDRAAWYENAFMREGGDVGQSVEEHEQMIRAMEQGDSQLIRTLIEGHWRRSLEFVQDWLRMKVVASKTTDSTHKDIQKNEGGE